MGVRTEPTDDYVAIRRLQAAYADIVSRRAYAELENIFLPDTVVVMGPGEHAEKPRQVTGPESFGKFVDAYIGHLEFFQFVVLNAVVDLAVDGDPNRATGRVHICELWKDPRGRSSAFFGLYLDDYTKIADSWWYGRRTFKALGVSRRDFTVFGYPEFET
jgi:hypothetical protein